MLKTWLMFDKLSCPDHRASKIKTSGRQGGVLADLEGVALGSAQQHDVFQQRHQEVALQRPLMDLQRCHVAFSAHEHPHLTPER